MAYESDKEKRIFFSCQQLAAGTPNTTCFFEGRGDKMAFPEPEYQLESDKNKMGSGEHGKKAELQALWTPWSYTCDRMSELLYFLSYFQGKAYTPVNNGTPQVHEIYHLYSDERTLPIFSMEYGTGGTGNNKVFADCIVNEISLTAASGGNGVVEFTVSGWGNRHKKAGGAFVEHSAGNMSAGTYSFASEPLVNYKCIKTWIGDTMNDVDANSVSISGPDIGDATNISHLINSITITGNNGMSAADMARAGGCGIINDFTRGDREFTLEVGFRKNNSIIETDVEIIANAQKVWEFSFNGPYIDGTNPYAIDILFPVVQFTMAPEDTGNPINKTGTMEVFEDSDKNAMIIIGQSEVSVAYNS